MPDADAPYIAQPPDLITVNIEPRIGNAAEAIFLAIAIVLALRANRGAHRRRR